MGALLVLAAGLAGGIRNLPDRYAHYSAITAIPRMYSYASIADDREATKLALIGQKGNPGRLLEDPSSLWFGGREQKYPPSRRFQCKYSDLSSRCTMCQ
jgi:hypothetical protein